MSHEGREGAAAHRPDKCHHGHGTADLGWVHVSQLGGAAEAELGNQGLVF